MSAAQQAPGAQDSSRIIDLHQSARSFKLATPLKLAGQGTVSLGISAQRRFSIVLSSDDNLLGVEIDSRQVCVFQQRKGEQRGDIRRISAPLPQQDFLNGGREQTYWISLDKVQGRFRFGRGELHERLCDLEFDYDACMTRDDLQWILSLREITLNGHFTAAQLKKARCRYRKLPVTRAPAPLVLSPQQLDLQALEAGSGIISSALSRECQLLYRHVQSASLRLNTPDFPDFADAINHSIATPGGLCQQRLSEKSSAFNSTRQHQSYLRIGVGANLGASPGAPFVLEIWPGQHYSPIHQHADCHAIIKVLHGSISCMWYRSLAQQPNRPYGQTILTEGQVTWLDPGHYQTHRLFNHNVGGNMCATLQCYQYGSTDDRHYEYFDYLNEENAGIEQFTPRTDWGYSEFREKIRQEWESYKQALGEDTESRLI